MDLGLHGKVAVVTGGSSGIGFETAYLLGQEGARVAICARGEDRLRSAARRIASETGAEVLQMRADTTRSEDIERLSASVAQRWGGIDVLVNNAGLSMRGTLERLTDADWRTSLQTKLFGFVELTQQVVPHMRRAGGGRIVNVVGQFGRHPPPDAIAAAATNASVLAISKALADALAPENILLNVVCPSRIDTPLPSHIWRDTARQTGLDDESARKALADTVPMRRLGRPDEVASVIVFLISRPASFVCGTTISVDGGFQRYIV
jgi:NAD(P)-dependent dehydrogenase (short-subunit alcohol dehydrogenase family)